MLCCFPDSVPHDGLHVLGLLRHGHEPVLHLAQPDHGSGGVQVMPPPSAAFPETRTETDESERAAKSTRPSPSQPCPCDHSHFLHFVTRPHLFPQHPITSGNGFCELNVRMSWRSVLKPSFLSVTLFTVQGTFLLSPPRRKHTQTSPAGSGHGAALDAVSLEFCCSD